MRERSYNKGNTCEICGTRTVNGYFRCKSHRVITEEMRESLRKGQLRRIANGNHNNYKGGISAFTRSRHANIVDTMKGRIMRKKVFKRDNYTCQKCGKTNCYLELHHIIPIREIDTPDYIPLAYCEENGITLCRKCHNETKFGRENKFIDEFIQIITNKYTYDRIAIK